MDVIVRTTFHATLAVLGLSPDSQHPLCDWCGKKAADGEAHGRWWFHQRCRDKARQFMLRSLIHEAVEWVYNEASPAPRLRAQHQAPPGGPHGETVGRCIGAQNVGVRAGRDR